MGKNGQLSKLQRKKENTLLVKKFKMTNLPEQHRKGKKTKRSDNQPSGKTKKTINHRMTKKQNRKQKNDNQLCDQHKKGKMTGSNNQPSDDTKINNQPPR